jgi:hypothetical protein
MLPHTSQKGAFKGFAAKIDPATRRKAPGALLTALRGHTALDLLLQPAIRNDQILMNVHRPCPVLQPDASHPAIEKYHLPWFEY